MLNNFIGLYPVQKTLRFELKPQESSKKFLDTTQDFLRAEAYPTLKKILDDYYRYYIDEMLSKPFDLKVDLNKTFEQYVENKKKTLKEYESSVKKIEKAVSVYLKGSLEDYGIKEYSKLLKADSSFRNWLKERLDKQAITSEEYENAQKTIKIYNGFLTCLTGFKQNRDNMFEESGSTAIAFRVVQNMERFFDNCLVFEKLQKEHPETKEVFSGVEEYFLPENYRIFISQKQIDYYNEIIGHSAKEIAAKGINQKLNEFTQRNGLKRKDVPLMSVLYKQILSDRPPFLADAIESDEDVFALINVSYENFFETVKKLTEVLVENIEDGNNVFVTRNSVNDISQKLFSEREYAWSVIDSAIELYCGDKKIKKDKMKDYISLADMQKAVDYYFKEIGEEGKNIKDFLCDSHFEEIEQAIKNYSKISGLKEIDSNRQAPSETRNAGKGYEQVQIIKTLLDGFISALHTFKPFYLKKDGKDLRPEGMNGDFYNEFCYQYEKLAEVVPLYNKIRNYLTTAIKIDKSKVRNFLGSSNLLNGWSDDIENNGCYFFFNDRKYYLVDVLDKNRVDINKLDENDGKSWRVDYFLQKLDSKNFPRIFIISKKFEERARSFPKFDEVKRVYEQKLYLKSAPISSEEYKNNLVLMIDYFKYALSQHESYCNIKFDFKESNSYKDILEFYNDAMKSGYSIEKVPTNFEYVKELERENAILLFQIYCKDFSDNKTKKGTPNLHTMYFEALFSDENINRIKEGKPFFQLNGGAQIYTRNKSIDGEITHERNVPISNKNPLNTKKESLFSYDLIKNKRFSETKMFLHFPITINAGTEGYKGNRFNIKVNKFLYNNPDINIIGLDRGERNLLYYSVIDRKGNILEQNTFNVITGKYNGGEIKTDYHQLLDEKETARDIARKTWGKIESISDLKAGYLSTVIPFLTKLMIKYNAVIVLENLNKGMKNSRAKVEKQVYQKFEHAIIDKLNYVVFKDRKGEEIGGTMNGFQFTDKVNQYEDIGKQTGFMFYIDPSYTSKICPKTGFVNVFHIEYTSVERAKDFFSKFESIRFNPEENLFEFTFDYNAFGDYSALKRTKWTVCSNGCRWYYSRKENKYVAIDLTSAIRYLLEKYGVDIDGTKELKDKIVQIDEKDFFKQLLGLLKLTMQLRNTKNGSDDASDYILSCVKDKDGKFFDSREANENEPNNADANGAYHIALKGLWVIEHIKEDGTYDDCTRKDWFEYRQ